jgi:hypothetical protein
MTAEATRECRILVTKCSAKLAIARKGMKWKDNINITQESGNNMCHTI